MELAVAVASGFALALIAPSVHRVLRDGAGWALALLPAGLAVYFASLIPDMPREGLRMSIPWAPSLGLQFSLLCDGLSALMALLISGVGALVLIYAGGYFHGRREAVRLYVLLLAFMASMLGVVLADNVLTLFVFWELTSFTSYLLIGFDHERPAARAAALQALLVTGGGGLALLAGLLLLGRVGADNGLSLVDSLQLSSLLPLGEAAAAHPLYAPILILVCLGAFTKSAQVPFHFWLPGAMAAPTPVSAYLHSATMVKAGVYLLARLSPLLGGTELWTGLVGAVGGATMLTGAVLALRETDLKLVLAYTTVSALGALTLLVGLDTPHCAVAAAAYLAAHGMYKGALFLVAGAVDHSVHTRDVTQLSGLARAMPLTAVAAGLAALSMAGLPPLFGFVAKELLYDAALHGPAASAAVAVAVGASVLLVAAAAVVGVRPFLGGVSDKAKLAHEVAGSLLLGPLLLAGLGVVVGLLPGVLGDALVGGAAAALAT
ncbi:MAG TPA: proton-conducting transporter membrane subunit, partial [Lacipirellulaceae bacterium]|nr:proton-conducting transporter membrane subunit [Lacipirellulaceae bacterium]